MGDALLHSIEANSYVKEVTDSDRDDGGEEEHRRASERPNWSSKVVDWRVGELHRGTVKGPEVIVWLEKGRSELSVAVAGAAAEVWWKQSNRRRQQRADEG
jgi:hypothetical protein